MMRYDRQNQMTHQQLSMLTDIQKLHFAVTDLALFLDTHPNDPVALYRHHTYASQLRQYRDAYEAQYGPLCNMNPEMSDTWRYINSPWPWEM